MPKIKPARIRARGNKDRTWRPLPGFGDGVYPVVKTDKMIQPVGRDEKGRLFTAPTGGGGGSGTVTSVAGVEPDETGNVPLTPEDIGAAEIDVTDEEVNLVVVSGTAAVGQTIVVDSVDEDGYPVSWHAVNLPEGGAGTVTSVNGVVPDESGNVELDIPESGGEWERFRYFAVPSAEELESDTSGITWFADEANNVYGFEIETNEAGEPFEYCDLYIKVRQGGSAGATKSADIFVNDVKIGTWKNAQINLVNRVGKVKIERYGYGYELAYAGLDAFTSYPTWTSTSAMTNGGDFANGDSGKVDGSIRKLKIICAPENYFPSDYLVGIWGKK